MFGGIRSAVRAAESNTQAAQANLSQVQVSMAAEIAVTYIELRGLQARLAIARSNLAAQKDTLQIARWRVQAGLVLSLDVEQALAASEQTAAQIPTLSTSLAQAISSLAVLTVQARDTVQDQVKADPALAVGSVAAVPVAPPGVAIAIPATTLRQRPDVVASEYRVSRRVWHTRQP